MLENNSSTHPMALVCELAQPEKPATTALTRSLSDLDHSRWFGLVALSAAVRTTLQHPINLAIARKRVNREKTTVVRIWSQSVQQGGFSSLYRGFPLAFSGSIVAEIVYVGVLEFLRERFPARSSLTRDMAAGFTSDLATLCVCLPIFVACNRQMTAGWGLTTHEHLSAAKTFRAAWRTQRWGGVYAGFSASLFAVPSSALWWGLYGKAKKCLVPTRTAVPQHDPCLHNLCSSNISHRQSIHQQRSLRHCELRHRRRVQPCDGCANEDANRRHAASSSAVEDCMDLP